MKKLLLILFVLSTVFLTGCEVLFGVVLVPYLLIESGCNAVSATVGEHFDAWSDQRPRTVFSLEVPKAVPFEKYYVTQGYKHAVPDCRFVILYRRQGKLFWQQEFYLDWRDLGDELTRARRHIPKYRMNPVMCNERICLISPEAGDEIVVLAASDSLREIGCFSVPFSKLTDFTGSYSKNDLHYNSCFFSGMFGKRFPHKIIKVPAWEKLSLLDGESKKYYLEKIFGESDRMRKQYGVEMVQ